MDFYSKKHALSVHISDRSGRYAEETRPRYAQTTSPNKKIEQKPANIENNNPRRNLLHFNTSIGFVLQLLLVSMD